jgi:hypothetical protein
MGRFVDEAKGRIDDLNRKAVMLAAQGLVLKSPVGNPELWAVNAEAAYGRAMHNEFADAAKSRGEKGSRRMSQKKLKETYALKAGKGYIGGRFRANWQFGFGSINKTTTEETDKSGQSSQARIEAAVSGVEAGGICWVTNSLPYAHRLENGWSKQAPIGMVKVTFAELPNQLQAYLRSLP